MGGQRGRAGVNITGYENIAYLITIIIIHCVGGDIFVNAVIVIKSGGCGATLSVWPDLPWRAM